MHKVVIERPRWNPGRGKHGRRANLPYDLLPKFEGIKRPHVNRKGLTDLLGPLRRWLQAQVGRPWNDIYSEACAVIKPDSIIRSHIKTHLLEFVERYAFMQNGQIYVLDTFPGGGPTPLFERCRRNIRFFVHPETGLLQVIPRISRRVWKAREPKPPKTIHWIRRDVAIQQVRGLWFECRYEVVPVERLFRYDHALERIITRKEALRLCYQSWHHLCTRKRQLSKHELRRLGLRNAITNPSIGTQSSACRMYGWLKTVLQLFVGSLFCRNVRSMMPKNEPYHSFLYGLGCGQLRAFSE
jgi:hypothetical protein